MRQAWKHLNASRSDAQGANVRYQTERGDQARAEADLERSEGMGGKEPIEVTCPEVMRVVAIKKLLLRTSDRCPRVVALMMARGDDAVVERGGWGHEVHVSVERSWSLA